MASENETFDEVLRCMQNDIVHFVGKPVKHSRDLLQEYHDRFKAAHHREVAELKSKMNDVVCENEALRDACGTCGAKREREATREKPSQVGNSAKMRDALKGALEAIKTLSKTHNNDLPEDVRALLGGIAFDATEALSAPPRNCDIGNALEQVSRHRIWCKCGGGCAVSCKMCFAKWSQMPYEEGGAK